MFDHPGFAVAEVHGVPVVDAGDDEEVVVHEIRAAWMVDVGTRRGVEQRLGVLRGERRRGQIRTAVARTVDRVMNPVIAPDGPQNPVLDVVQGQVHSGDLGVHVVPRAGLGNPALVDVADGVHGVGVQHHLHGQRIVEVDPVRLLFRARIFPRINRLKGRKVARQRGGILGVGLERGIIEAVHAGRMGLEIPVQEPLPGAVVDLLGIRFVADVPARQQFRLGRRHGARRHHRQAEQTGTQPTEPSGTKNRSPLTRGVGGVPHEWDAEMCSRDTD